VEKEKPTFSEMSADAENLVFHLVKVLGKQQDKI
jgi:hypothetical protein